jgi:hypothetical protein
MKATLMRTTLALVLAGGLAAPALQAKGKKHNPKHSPAHAAALQNCREAYEATAAALHAPNSRKGSARQRAMHAAAQTKKACIANAPR